MFVPGLIVDTPQMFPSPHRASLLRHRPRLLAIVPLAVASLVFPTSALAGKPKPLRTATTTVTSTTTSTTSSLLDTAWTATNLLRPFLPTSPWNAPIAANPVIDPASDFIVSKLVGDLPAYGPWINTTSYSAPIYQVGAGQPKIHVIADTTNTLVQGWFNSVPLPADAHPAQGTDGELILWQPSTDTLWEFWQLHKDTSGRWHTSWGGRIDHASLSSGVYGSHYGASASSMSLLGSEITIDDMQSGVINHAIGLGVPNTALRFVAPATWTDGKTQGGIPIGSRLQLDPAIDVDSLHLSRTATMIAKAAQKYGILVRETSGAVTFYAQDPSNLGSDPWPGYLGGLSPKQALAGFPWARLRVLAP
jgi:hypothetical protein